MNLMISKFLIRGLTLVALSIGFSLPAETIYTSVFVPSPSGPWIELNRTPFSLVGSSNSIRWQEVVSASEFDGISSNGFYITGIYLVQARSFSVDFEHLQINLSTTPRGPDALSPIFNENVGSDDLVVFSGKYHAGLGSPVLTFARPFYYDPSQGNLLLDFLNFSGMVWDQSHQMESFPPYMLISNNPGDTISSVVSTNVDCAEGYPVTYGLEMYIALIPESGVKTHRRDRFWPGFTGLRTDFWLLTLTSLLVK